MTSRRPPPIPAGADAPILTGRLLLQPVVEGDAEALAELFLDERMYRFTGGQPGTLDDLRATFARIQTDLANDRDGRGGRPRRRPGPRGRVRARLPVDPAGPPRVRGHRARPLNRCRYHRAQDG
jgi:RimJ/RimL family protein N-acetyltransferase